MTNRRSRVIEGSCWTCRKRRIKCDLRKPSCTRCLDGGQTCSYSNTPPVKWVGGSATRGRLAGPHSPISSGLALGALPATQPLKNSEVILYFANEVMPRLQIPDKPINLDLDNVLQDEPLRQTIIAVSQAHYALHSKVSVYDVAVIRKKTRQTAIEGFLRCLGEGVHSESSAQRLFAISILFCVLDGMIAPSEEHNVSTCHLRGGCAILDQWTNTPTRMLLQDGWQAHMLSLYTTIDLVHALLSGDKPFFEPMIWRMFANVQTWFGRLRVGDRFLEILAAFSDMAALGNIVYANLPLDSVRLVEKCLAPIEAIFDSRPRHEGFFDDPNTSLSSPWTSFCSIYDICGIIYLQRALRLRSMDDEMVQAATRRGVEKLKDGNLPGMMRHCVIFPILVIGSHCNSAQDRRAILDALSASSSYLAFRNMPMMVDFLRATWAREEVHATWWETFASVSQKTFLF